MFWYSADAAGYVTSSYYGDALPEWVARFNAGEMPSLVAQALPWTLGVPESARALALPDDTPWEGEPAARVFPHATDANDPAEAFTSVPGLDDATLRLAEEGVRALELGRRGSTDVLMINLSSLDEAGHSFGPWSLEQLDALWRVDGDLGRFLSFLDAEVGRGRWASGPSPTWRRSPTSRTRTPSTSCTSKPRATDVAPTLAALGGIPAPGGLDGQALLPALLSRSARPTCRGAGGSAP